MTREAIGMSVAQKVSEEVWMWSEFAAGWVPGRIGKLVRMIACRPFLRAGEGLQLEQGVTIRGHRNLVLGDRVGIGRGCWINARGGIKIGDDVMIGPGVLLATNGHVIRSVRVPMRDQGLYEKPITIGSDVWIGANSILLPGVTVGDGVVIGANSTVVKDVAPFSVVGSHPARFLKQRAEQDGE